MCIDCVSSAVKPDYACVHVQNVFYYNLCTCTNRTFVYCKQKRKHVKAFYNIGYSHTFTRVCD